MRRRRQRKPKLDLKLILLGLGAYFFIFNKASSGNLTAQQPINYWVDASGNVTYAPGITPPAGAIRPASEYEIEQSQGTM